MQDNSLKEEDSMKSNVISDFMNRGLKMKLDENSKNQKRCHSNLINTHTHFIAPLDD